MDDRNKALVFLLVTATTMGILVSLDLVTDYMEGSSLKHLIVESMLLCFSMVAFVYSLMKLIQTKSENRNLMVKMSSVTAEKDKWRNEASDLIKGLSSKIEEQFANWHLSGAETEVGFLLLKGFALKEIAEIRGTKLKTVQQQAQSIYHKTKLSNRSELSAFFLEDLLPPIKQSKTC